MKTHIAAESGVVQFYRPRTTASHLSAIQQVKSGSPVWCPSCKILTALRKLRNHTIVAHGYGAVPTIDAARLPPTGLTSSQAVDATGNRHSPESAYGRSSSSGADQLVCSLGMGSFTGEGGLFGSMPTYADFGQQGLV